MNENMKMVENKILRNMEELLEDFGYDPTQGALKEILRVWRKNKEQLISLLARHPAWDSENCMIVFDHDYERGIQMDAIREFIAWIDGESVHLPSMMRFWILSAEPYVSEKWVRRFKDCEGWTVHRGEKTSRVVNRLCKQLEIGNLAEYDREFAKYADAITPLKIRRHTVISVNPLDYLTMSFGNSWSSCHTIDKENKRKNGGSSYNGCYSSGTISYMLDSTSVIMYTIDENFDGRDYWRAPGKINRQMWHIAPNADFMVQGRMYPQDNDGAKEIYDLFRAIMQKVMSECGGFPNLWKLRRGTEEIDPFVDSEGTHYMDYKYYNSCTVSINKSIDMDAVENITIGHPPICIKCGEYHDIEDSIQCCPSRSCAHCGANVSDDPDAVEIDGEWYCGECVEYCSDCGEWYLIRELHYLENYGRYVCDNCLSDHYYRCDVCGEYMKERDIDYFYEDGYGDRVPVCDSCYEKYCHTCSQCGTIRADWFLNACEENENGEWVCPECMKEQEEST